MIRKVCAVYDRATGLYGQPFFVPALGAATRSFSDEINRPAPDNSLYQHPGDYELWCIGEYNDETAAIKTDEDIVRVLARGTDVQQQSKVNP